MISGILLCCSASWLRCVSSTLPAVKRMIHSTKYGVIKDPAPRHVDLNNKAQPARKGSVSRRFLRRWHKDDHVMMMKLSEEVGWGLIRVGIYV